jgi:hypothetical protein
MASQTRQAKAIHQTPRPHVQTCPLNTSTLNRHQEGHPSHRARSLMIPWTMYPQATTVLRHSSVVQKRNPTSKRHTRKSDLTVSRRRPAARQHTRKSVLIVSRRRPAAGCRIKQQIKSHRVPTGKQINVLTRRRHSHWSSSASLTKSEASQSQCEWNQNSSLT